MDDAVNRLARELADAIAAAVASDARVARCRTSARAEGYDLHVSLEAIIGFSMVAPDGEGDGQAGPAERSFDLSAQDRRFLRSLRIAGDEALEKTD
jgi:hypothetical protein